MAAKNRDPRIARAPAYASAKRELRYPKHPFLTAIRPYQVQPVACVPVLPGETMKNAVLQARVVSKPVKSQLTGWWSEFWLFYVSLRSIEKHIGTAFLSSMVTTPSTYNPATISAAIGSGADVKYYHAAGGTNWLKAGYGAIIDWYFRDQGEVWTDYTLDGLALAQMKGKSWIDSLTLASAKRTDMDFDLDTNNDGDLTAREFLDGMAHFEALRDAGLAPADYEDWISTFGVEVPERQDESEEIYKPEFLRHWSEWAYPVNTVDPTSGVPSSALSWIHAHRADKDRFFREPGFIIALQCARPKVYIKDQLGQLASFMGTIENWLPALSHHEPERGYENFAAAAGPFANKVDTASPKAYWVDYRDLFRYGDQFVNVDPATVVPALTIMDASAKHRYPLSTDIDGLFSAAAPANVLNTDGVLDFVIAGKQGSRDRTPQGGPI